MRLWMGTLGALLLCACSATDEKRLEDAHQRELNRDSKGAYAAYRDLYEETGNAEAAFALGKYAGSHAQEQAANPANAFYYYSAAAEKNHPGALFALAGMYEHGIGTPVNRAKALELYCRSAKYSNMEARLYASEIYLTDPKLADTAKGIALLQEGAAQENLQCMMRLASFYMGAVDTANRDEKKARALYEKMAERNVPEALYFLAVSDYLGIGCPKSAKNGRKSMLKAASSGSAEAWFFLGMLLERQGKTERAEKYRQKARALYGTSPFAGVQHVKLWNSFEEMERAVKSAFRIAYPR